MWTRFLIELSAGFGAGFLNTVVGAGSLISFPILLALGFAPVTANVTNTLGLVSGSISASFGFRKELANQWRRAGNLGLFACLGGISGAILLINFPNAFGIAVPILILFSVVIIYLQPKLAIKRRTKHRDGVHSLLLYFGVLITAIYGGYFGAAQGLLLVSLFGICIDDTIHRLNGLKSVLVGLVNGVSAIVFILFAQVAYMPALLIAIGSIAGAQIGAKISLKTSARTLRPIFLAVGVATALYFVVTEFA